MKRLCIAVFAAIAALGSVSVAYAQPVTTTLPCGSGTGRNCGFDRSQDLGVLRENQSFSITNNCDFVGTATKTFNGASAGTGVGPCVNTTGQVIDDGVGVANALGRFRPVLAALGVKLAQAVRAPRVRIDGVVYTANALGVRNAIVVQGTASDTGTGRWTNYFTIAGPAGSNVGGTGLGRTGIMVLRWSLLGGALVAVGALFVLAARRRRIA